MRTVTRWRWPGCWPTRGTRVIVTATRPYAPGCRNDAAGLPVRGVFWLYLGLCALALTALAMIPETVRAPDRRVSPRPGLGSPPDMRAVVTGACLGGFAAFSILGFFSSLVPTFLHGILGVGNLAWVGAASFLVFIIAAISQAASARLPARRSMTVGLPLLVACLVALESALFAKALWLFPAGTVIGVVLRSFGTTRAAAPPGWPSDSWCCPAGPAGVAPAGAERPQSLHHSSF